MTNILLTFNDLLHGVISGFIGLNGPIGLSVLMYVI